MATNFPVNPRVRAYGKARIDIARRAQSLEDWQKLWKLPTHSFPFRWGESWKQCIEYKVDDFAAEVGFYIDVLSLPVNAFDPDYAMFTSPQGDFFFAVVPAPEGTESTPPDAIRIQFMVADILATTQELSGRGIAFEQDPQPVQPQSTLYIGTFRTPHGIPIDLWGVVKRNGHSPAVKSVVKSLEEEQDDQESILAEDEAGEDDGGWNFEATRPAQPQLSLDEQEDEDDFEEDEDEDGADEDESDPDDIEYVDVDNE